LIGVPSLRADNARTSELNLALAAVLLVALAGIVFGVNICDVRASCRIMRPWPDNPGPNSTLGFR
jgi:hypothetical protein